MSDTKLLRHFLENDPFQETLSSQERAYFLSSLTITYAHTDETLYTSKSPCEFFYYIVQGSILLPLSEGKNTILKPGMVFGEESLLGLAQYSAKSTAQEPTTLLRFSAPQGQKIVEDNAAFRKALLTCFTQKFQVSPLKPLKKELAPSPAFSASVTLLSAPTKWGLSLLVPLFSYIFMRTYEIDLNLHLLITLFSAILCLWSFSLVPAYGAAFLMLTGSLILNFTSSAKLFSSLAGNSFMILIFILGFGRALQTSSIPYRLMLKILKFMPPTHFWTNSAIFSLSAFFTPFVPSSGMRQKMMQGIVQHFITQLSLSPTSATAQKIALSTYAGTTLLGPIFLTSSVYNLFMLSILRHDQSHFQWWEWFAGTMPTCCFLLLFFSLGLGLFFKEDERCGLFRDRIEAQLKVIGPLEGQDRSLVCLLGVYSIALSTSTFHGLSEGFISLLMTCLLMVFYFLPYPQKPLKNDETLASIVLFISLTSLITIFNGLNVSSYLQPYLSVFQTLHENNFTLFTLALGLTLTLVRLFIPYGLTVFGASAIFLPFASLQGINPWLMGFLILLFSKESLFPTTRSSLRTFLDETLVYDPQPRTIILKYHLLIIVVKFLAVYCSITFWKEMSLI